jgi:hypothetical protein
VDVENNKIVVKDYAKSDYFDATAPFEFVYSFKSNPFVHERVLTLMCEKAKSVGVNNFKKLYAAYTANLAKTASVIYSGNVTDFSGQPLELDAGDWRCSDDGVTGIGEYGAENVACPHPILPVERLVNIDTGEEKLKLAYSKGKRWRSIVVDKNVIASAQSIVKLASTGIAVTSENARCLIRYLADVENINYDRIPERSSVSRLGFIGDEGFSPYVDGLVFDGEASYRNIFEAVKPHGSMEQWLEAAQECRKKPAAKIVLAAAFASVLSPIIGTLPFFVHLWGIDSSTGKTVALMLAASVWGNPAVGQYVQTFNATDVGHERLAAFLNNLPMCIDELQLSRTVKGKPAFNVYLLAQGAGRTRGNKVGGIDKTPTWSNCIITTGESPLANIADGAGALNRIIEIECKADNKVIEDGPKISGIIKKNYGLAGKEFVRCLESQNIREAAAERYKSAYLELSANDTTEKQAMAAALIITADAIATELLFHDGAALTCDEISGFLKTNAAVSLGERGYALICGWVAQNVNRFDASSDNLGEVYGVAAEDDWVYINSKKFREVVESEGISSSALLSWLKSKGKIRISPPHNTVSKRIKGVVTQCVLMKLEEETAFDSGEML